MKIKLNPKVKLALFGTLAAAIGGVADVAGQGALTPNPANPDWEQVGTSAAAAALMGMIGFWLKSPKAPSPAPSPTKDE